MGSKPFRSNFSYFLSQENFGKILYFFERGVRERKGIEDRCEKESRERQWDPQC